MKIILLLIVCTYAHSSYKHHHKRGLTDLDPTGDETEDVPEYDSETPEDHEDQETPVDPELEQTVDFVNDSEREHLQNYKKISEDIKIYEDEYSDCIKDIPDEEYSEAKIEECAGKDLLKVKIDIKYEIMRIISKADSKVRDFFLNLCYIPAADDDVFSKGCDVFESDTLDLIWGGLNFVELIELNKDKYLQEYATLPETTVEDILTELVTFSEEFFELLNEVDNHKEITLLRIKTLIDDRTKLIV